LFGGTYLKEIELIPLSNDTVARRIEDMAKWVEDQLISRVKGSKFFSLQLDESTDIQGLSQLIEFNRFVWNSQPHEDILFCEPIIQGTSEEIFETLDAYVKSKELTAGTVLVYVRMVHGQCVVRTVVL
ncbi:Zinc finger BED domain-containing protein 5, partial [Trichinella spiralis]